MSSKDYIPKFATFKFGPYVPHDERIWVHTVKGELKPDGSYKLITVEKRLATEDEEREYWIDQAKRAEKEKNEAIGKEQVQE